MMPRAWPLTTTRSSISRLGNAVDRALFDLPHHRLVGAEQQLLAGLAARVERARHLRAAERPVVEQAAVLARERHALRDALVDDVDAQLREPEDVRLARAVVAALDRVVEQPLDAVAVVLVVLGGVDAPLRGDAVRAARAVVDAEALDVVAELAERRRGRRAGEAGADDDASCTCAGSPGSPASIRTCGDPTCRRAARREPCDRESSCAQIHPHRNRRRSRRRSARRATVPSTHQPLRVDRMVERRATGTRWRCRGAGASRRAPCRPRRTPTQNGDVNTSASVRYRSRIGGSPIWYHAPNLNCCRCTHDEEQDHEPGPDHRRRRDALAAGVAGPATSSRSPTGRAPGCAIHIVTALKMCSRKTAAAPISAGTTSGFEISVCAYSLNVSWPGEDQQVAGEVEQQIREEQQAGESDEQLRADRRGEHPPEGRHRL